MYTIHPPKTHISPSRSPRDLEGKTLVPIMYKLTVLYVSSKGSWRYNACAIVNENFKYYDVHT